MPCHLPSIADSVPRTAGNRQPPEISSSKTKWGSRQILRLLCHHQALIKENTTDAPVILGREPLLPSPPPHSQHQDERGRG